MRLLLTLLVSCPLHALDLPPVLGDPPAANPREWRERVAPALRESFAAEVFGRAPLGRPEDLRFEVAESDPAALDGRAVGKEIAIAFAGETRIRLTLVIPKHAPRPVPVFLLICNRERELIEFPRRGPNEFFPAEEIVAAGYAAAAFHNSDLDPDEDDGFRNGVHALYDPPGERKPDAWATIAAWAWGASRAMDYLESDPDLDASRVALVGHSRGGKTALWAGATDPRFAMVVSGAVITDRASRYHGDPARPRRAATAGRPRAWVARPSPPGRRRSTRTGSAPRP